MKFHTLAWPNVAQRMLECHDDVAKHWGLNVEYHLRRVPHGEWMDWVCANLFSSGEKIVCFLEVDALPTNKNIVGDCYDWVERTRGVLGIAQTANHLDPTHVYAGPAFYMIHKDAWNYAGVSFSETRSCDVAQLVTRQCEGKRIPVRCLYPSHYLMLPENERWYLGNYGMYGRGTYYRAGLFHLFQGRLNNSVNVFADICEKIVDNKFTTKGWHECERL